MGSIRLDGVTKRFGLMVAVDHLDLDIADGEFMVLLGPSGCGKSTALRMIAGLEDISEGDLYIGDIRQNLVEARNRNIAMVFQSYALYPHLTVRKNIESPLKVRKYTVDGESEPRRLNATERKLRVDDVAAILGLTEYLDRKPAALSGGQRQRVALARAIVSRPQAFLMDEPLSNLDAKLRAQTRAELIEMHQRLGITVVYVTHDQVEAMTMAQRIAVMKDGKLQQVGTPREVYENPANVFVAGFIGTPPMNFLDATVSAPGQAVLDMPGSPELAVRPGGQAGTRVTLGVRPEHLTVVETGGVPIEVRTVEWLGHETLLSCSPVGVADKRLMLRHEGAMNAAVGQRLNIAAPAERVHLFNAATGDRI